MKKRILSVLVCLCMISVLLPSAVTADNRIYVSTVNLTIEPPQAGMTKQEGTELALLSAQTAYGDLAASGAVKLFKLSWKGEFDKTGHFQAGRSYIATVQLQFVYESGYVANHTLVNDGYHMDNSVFAVTVNGLPAETQQGSPGFPIVKVSIAIPAPEMSAEEKNAAEAERLAKFNLRHKTLRGFGATYTKAQADAVNPAIQQYDTIVVDNSMIEYENLGLSFYSLYESKKTPRNKDYISKLIIDVGSDAFATQYKQDEFALYLFTLPNLKEIWLGDKWDAVSFVKNLKSGTEGAGSGIEKHYWTQDTGFCNSDATLFISSDAAAKLKAAYSDEFDTLSPCFTIKVYDGDVYTAQKAGASAAHDYCTNHTYTAYIMSPDRICRYATCSNKTEYYYSCKHCGKCEYNPSHVYDKDFMTRVVAKGTHQYEASFATDEAYIGVNAAGDYVYWKTCIYCNHSYNYHQEHATWEDLNNSGMNMTFEQYQQFLSGRVAEREAEALGATVTKNGMFTLSARSTAAMSDWAKSDVNFAQDNRLLDISLLGSDYTAPITRLQFCSVAVRLAEELTGKEIAAAPAGTFTDTDNLYVRKAYAAGITSGVSATEFNPDGTLNRQQMATFLYRTLRYVEKNSDYRYTDYTSRLSSYADSDQIQSWASESMAFMNALDLIKGTTETTLAPNGNCTIEQAVAVAYRSIYAHQIGWYQVKETIGYENPTSTDASYAKVTAGSLVWITGNRMGGGTEDTMLDNMNGKYSGSYCNYPTVSPYTGQTVYLSAMKLRPVRNG